MSDKVTIELRRCGRCGGNHIALELTPYKGCPPKFDGVRDATHWAVCPIMGDPIIVCRENLTNNQHLIYNPSGIPDLR